MKWVRALILSTVVTTGASLVLLSAIAFFVCRSGSLPRGSVTIITTIAACAAVFLGGFLSTISVREKGLLLGLGAGAVFLICAGAVSVLVFQVELGPASAGKIAAVLLSGAIGGVLGANRKSRVKF